MRTLTPPQRRCLRRLYAFETGGILAPCEGPQLRTARGLRTLGLLRQYDFPYWFRLTAKGKKAVMKLREAER